MNRVKPLCILLAASLLLLGGCAKTELSGTAPDSPGEESGQSAGDGEESGRSAGDGEESGQSAGNGEESGRSADGGAETLSFEARDMEGNTVTADIFSETELTMVNVWATYCRPCLREMPELGELAGEYDSGQFQILGIISDVPEDVKPDTLELVAELIEKTEADYPHLLLNRSLYDALLTDVTAVPTTFFIDKDGRILDTVIGAMEKPAWEEKINAFLEKE